MKSIRYIMYFVLMSMTMSLLAQENAQAVAQGENKIDEKVERNTIRKGNGLFNDKKYTEAEIEYRKALEANPSSEIATYNLGAALYKQQKWNDSRNEYRKIVQASSDSLRAAHAWHNLGNISFQEKNYAQSIEEYKNALRRNPKDDETRYNLRLAQLLLKKNKSNKIKIKTTTKTSKIRTKINKKTKSKINKSKTTIKITKIKIKINKNKINHSSNNRNNLKCRKRMHNKFSMRFNRTNEIHKKKSKKR